MKPLANKLQTKMLRHGTIIRKCPHPALKHGLDSIHTTNDRIVRASFWGAHIKLCCYEE